ncbi:MAG TPA: argininosuccinate lyase [bacterium]
MSGQKRQIWGNHLAAPPDALMVRFCAGRDVQQLPMADAELLPFDVWTNRAHAIMLHKQGITQASVLKAQLESLAALESDAEAGKFQLNPELEDVHVNVERYVSQRAGADVGGRLHTARSRNDQVVTDCRLYLRASLLEFGETIAALVGGLLDSAQAHTETVLPGFTHHQPAMLTTWGHWLCAYAQGLCRDLERVRSSIELLNRNPLGSAASFGTSWPIDRELTAELLGFDRVDVNTLDSVGSRWEHEAQAAATYSLAMNHLAVMAQDLILLSHPYWKFVALPDAYVTGSSIMPQKRNPDFAEVIKGKCAWLVGMTSGLLALPKGWMSGYNRDSQTAKYAIMDIVRECQPAPVIMKAVFGSLQVNQAAMRAALDTGFLAATDFADATARALGIPFRSAYDIAATAVKLSGDAGRITAEAATQALQQADQNPAKAQSVLADLNDPARILAWRKHTGSPAPESVKAQIAALRADLAKLSKFLPERRGQWDAAWQKCRDWKV